MRLHLRNDASMLRLYLSYCSSIYRKEIFSGIRYSVRKEVDDLALRLRKRRSHLMCVCKNNI